MSSIRFADLMDSNDVGMIQRRGGTRFLLKPAQPIFMCYEVIGKQFKGYTTAKSRVVGQVDFTHPATAEKFENLVWTKRLSRQQAVLMHGEQFRCNFQRWRANELTGLLVRSNERFHFSQQRLITNASLRKKCLTLFWPKLQRRVIYLANL